MLAVSRFGLTRWWERLWVIVVVVCLSIVLLGFVSPLVGLPGGYNSAQTASAHDLSELGDRWRALRLGATHDILFYVPIYVIYGCVLIALVSPGWSADRSRGWWRRLALWTWLNAGLLVAAGAADAAETGLFGRSLTRLIDGGHADDLASIVNWRERMTTLKLGLALAAVLVLVIRVAAIEPSTDIGTNPSK